MPKVFTKIHRELWEGWKTYPYFVHFPYYTHRKYSNKPENNKKLIWVYNINDFSLIQGAPFNSNSDCARNLKISRETVSTYLDINKPFANKWIFSFFFIFSNEVLSQRIIHPEICDAVVGDLLGDGHIRASALNQPNINGRLKFTFSTKNLPYAEYLKFTKHAPLVPCRLLLLDLILN